MLTMLYVNILTRDSKMFDFNQVIFFLCAIQLSLIYVYITDENIQSKPGLNLYTMIKSK